MQVPDVMSRLLTPEESAEFDARMAALREQPPSEDRWDIRTYADGTWTAMHSRQWGFLSPVPSNRAGYQHGEGDGADHEAGPAD